MSACAQNPAPNGDAPRQGQPAAATNKASAEATKAGAAVAPAADPSLLRFDAKSVKLDDAAQAQLQQLLEPARGAKQIVITGYCDRKEIGNAKGAAIARANAVKSALVKQGVAAKKIRVKYTTDEPLHAAKVDFTS
ncbi:OmpA family protein [Jeongeupia naejangsanensis]|uniref:OmpA family protein n=1 Tax=Jeongeupia naejangsanensis TaxID=613195 RepID=A0ABS2BSM2_9NEIS|nr:OmpA family protein [Jeongeupia naejangsanensis]